MDFGFTPADDEFHHEVRAWLEANRADAPPVPTENSDSNESLVTTVSISSLMALL